MVALSAPATARAYFSEGCPYRFGSPMPAGTFCVYRGSARDARGQLCSSELVVIWTSYGQPNESEKTIYLAAVSDPDIVLRANVTARRGLAQQANLVDYSVADLDRPSPAQGEIKRVTADPSHGAGDRLLFKLAGDRTPIGGGIDCDVSSFDGEFVGVISPPLQAARLD